MVLDEHAVEEYRRVRRRLNSAIRTKDRRHPNDVVALPLARLSGRVDQRNPLLINTPCLPVGIGPVIVGIQNLQLVAGIAAAGRRQKHTAVAARLVGSGDIFGNSPFNAELVIVEEALGFDIARAARLAYRKHAILYGPISRRFVARVYPLVEVLSIDRKSTRLNSSH